MHFGFRAFGLYVSSPRPQCYDNFRSPRYAEGKLLEKAKSVSRERIKMGDCANCESFFTRSTQPLTFFLFLTFLATFYQSSDGFSQNGGWSPWSKLQTPCQISEENTNLVECGGGVRIRHRSCSNPVAQGPLGKNHFETTRTVV